MRYAPLCATTITGPSGRFHFVRANTAFSSASRSSQKIGSVRQLGASGTTNTAFRPLSRNWVASRCSKNAESAEL